MRATFDSIAQSALARDIDAVRAGHLDTTKFTKFSGGQFERMDVNECNESEAAIITSIQDPALALHDVKIDVFGTTAIMTGYFHVSFTEDGSRVEIVSRVTVVFLNTADGWKIVHEHVTPKECFERAQP